MDWALVLSEGIPEEVPLAHHDRTAAEVEATLALAHWVHHSRSTTVSPAFRARSTVIDAPREAFRT